MELDNVSPLDLKADELAHYGVLGMKWGKRKDRGSRVSVPSEKPRKVASITVKRRTPRVESSDSKAVRDVRQKKVSELSNDELRKLTTRVQLEQQYSKLNPSTVKKGQNYVKAAIGFGAAGIALYNMYHSPAAQAAIKRGKEAYAAYLVWASKQ